MILTMETIFFFENLNLIFFVNIKDINSGVSLNIERKVYLFFHGLSFRMKALLLSLRNNNNN